MPSRAAATMTLVHSISETARAGIDLLKSGAVALKHGRAGGRPKETVFTLSADETELLWAPKHAGLTSGLVRRMSTSGSAGEKVRRINVDEVVELLVGRETAVFHRSSSTAGGLEHLSLSLKLMGSLPPPPSEADMSAPVEQHLAGRESLDLSFESEETFGLWVAALRHLLRKRQPVGSDDVSVPAAISLATQRSLDELFAKRPSTELGAAGGGSSSTECDSSCLSSPQTTHPDELVDDLFRSPPKLMQGIQGQGAEAAGAVAPSSFVWWGRNSPQSDSCATAATEVPALEAATLLELDAPTSKLPTVPKAEMESAEAAEAAEVGNSPAAV